MPARTDLTIYQEILLLALDDEKGTAAQGAMFKHALGGAIIAELAAAGAVKIADDKRKTVTAVPGRRPADELLAECWRMTVEAKKPKPAKHWVMKFAAIGDIEHRVAAGLVARGVLEEKTGTVLKIFKRRIYPETDSGPEKELRERLRRAIFTGTSQIEPRTIIVIALARATGMLERIFPKQELKQRKQRLEKLCSGEAVGKAAKEAVEAVQAAIVVAAVIPVIIAPTVTS